MICMRGKGFKNLLLFFHNFKTDSKFFERLQIRQFAAFLKLKILHNVDINAKQKKNCIKFIGSKITVVNVNGSKKM